MTDEKKQTNVHFIATDAKKGNDDRPTPSDFFESLNAEFSFGLDACASAENSKVDTFYTVDEDALSKTGREWIEAAGGAPIWMNPPYGRVIKNWLAKAAEVNKEGGTVVVLVPSRTDNGWFFKYFLGKSELRFVKGRLKFVGQTQGAPFPSLVAIMRPKPSSRVLAIRAEKTTNSLGEPCKVYLTFDPATDEIVFDPQDVAGSYFDHRPTVIDVPAPQETIALTDGDDYDDPDDPFDPSERETEKVIEKTNTPEAYEFTPFNFEKDASEMIKSILIFNDTDEVIKHVSEESKEGVAHFLSAVKTETRNMIQTMDDRIDELVDAAEDGTGFTSDQEEGIEGGDQILSELLDGIEELAEELGHLPEIMLRVYRKAMGDLARAGAGRTAFFKCRPFKEYMSEKRARKKPETNETSNATPSSIEPASKPQTSPQDAAEKIHSSDNPANIF